MANKLELTWVGKEERIEVEPRILIEVPDKSFSESADDLLTAATFDNMLIHGDNLLALKALESKFAGQVKCIYIDPPYNTGYAFEHYDDNLEHSQHIQERLEGKINCSEFVYMQIGSVVGTHIGMGANGMAFYQL